MGKIASLLFSLTLLGIAPSASANPNDDLRAAIKVGNVAKLKAAIDHGADVNAQIKADFSGLGLPAALGTPLHLAAANGHANVVAVLLDRGADIDARDSSGGTPLGWAATMSHLDVVSLLLARGASVHAQDSNGETPLHDAAGEKDIVALLLRFGADPNAKDNDGRTPAEYAAAIEAAAVEGILLSQSAKGEAPKPPLRPAPTQEPSAAATEAIEKGDLAYGQQDYTKAVAWYRKAAEQGNTDGFNRLGNMYSNGQGVEQDYATAVTWYRKAAAVGNADAQTNLGNMYRNGRSVPQNDAAAAAWYRKAAAQGRPDAQNNLGNMYLNGWGVPQDDATAVSWYRKSAAQGYASGQYNLGAMYNAGRGVQQDYATALTWYQKAAAHGDAAAGYGIGRLYEDGFGVPQDKGQARSWMQWAASAGDGNAKNWLANNSVPNPSAPTNPQASRVLPDCHDVVGLTRLVLATNPPGFFEQHPGALPRTIEKLQVTMGCRAPPPAPTYYAPEPTSAMPTPPAYSLPPVSGSADTTCMPFGNGGTRCTSMVPGQAATYTTCMPFGNGGTRCTTQ